MSAAIWSAIAATSSASCAFLILLIQRRNYFDSVRPDLVLSGWKREQTTVAGHFSDEVTFNTIRNIGRGAAYLFPPQSGCRFWCLILESVDLSCREIGKVGFGYFLFANTSLLTPKPEHIRADIESVGPCDDPVIDECLTEKTFVSKRLGNRAVHIFDMALEIKFGNQTVFVGECDPKIAVGPHGFKSWSHSSPSVYSYAKPVWNARTTDEFRGNFGREFRGHMTKPLARFEESAILGAIFLSLIFLSKELIRIHRERVQRAQEKDFVLLRFLCSFAVNFFEDRGIDRRGRRGARREREPRKRRKTRKGKTKLLNSGESG